MILLTDVGVPVTHNVFLVCTSIMMAVVCKTVVTLKNWECKYHITSISVIVVIIMATRVIKIFMPI